jgi:hypothetical protein
MVVMLEIAFTSAVCASESEEIFLALHQKGRNKAFRFNLFMSDEMKSVGIEKLMRNEREV